MLEEQKQLVEKLRQYHLTAQDKPPTNLKAQIAERNKTRINAFFANCYLSHSQGGGAEAGQQCVPWESGRVSERELSTVAMKEKSPFLACYGVAYS